MSAAALAGIQTISVFASILPCPKVLLDTTPFASVLARVEGTRFKGKSADFGVDNFSLKINTSMFRVAE